MEVVVAYLFGLVMGLWFLSLLLRNARAEADFYRRQVMAYMEEVLKLRQQMEELEEDTANGDGWKHA